MLRSVPDHAVHRLRERYGFPAGYSDLEVRDFLDHAVEKAIEEGKVRAHPDPAQSDQRLVDITSALPPECRNRERDVFAVVAPNVFQDGPHNQRGVIITVMDDITAKYGLRGPLIPRHDDGASPITATVAAAIDRTSGPYWLNVEGELLGGFALEEALRRFAATEETGKTVIVLKALHG